MVSESDTISSLLELCLRSRTRRLVLSFLMENPRTSFLMSQVCHETNIGSNQGIGAVRGIQGQYDPKLSLLKLGLVTEAAVRGDGPRARKLYTVGPQVKVQSQRIERILRRYRRQNEI